MHRMLGSARSLSRRVLSKIPPVNTRSCLLALCKTLCKDCGRRLDLRWALGRYHMWGVTVAGVMRRNGKEIPGARKRDMCVSKCKLMIFQGRPGRFHNLDGACSR
jgi:hypothetical protein